MARSGSGRERSVHVERVLLPPGSMLLRDPMDRRVAPSREGDVAIIGVPWDWSVTGRPGARDAPSAIRRELYRMTSHSPGLGSDISCSLVDLGDVAVAPGDYSLTGSRIRSASREAFSRYPLAVFLGGDHSITLHTVMGLLETVDSVGVLVMDSHYDLRSVSEGLTSGSWLWDLYTAAGDRIACSAVIGVSDYSNPGYLAGRARELGITIVPRLRLVGGLESALEAVDAMAGCGADAYYVSIDMDHIDEAHAPGVNSPTPLGMEPLESLQVLAHASARLNPKGLDVVETVPMADPGGRTPRLAAKLILYSLSHHGVCSRAKG